MGALCDWAVESLGDLWNWFFPPEREVPECVREWLEELFPDLDLDRVHVHEGLPPLMRISSPVAITLPGAGGVTDIHVYIRDGLPDACSCDEETGLALYAHELVHVQQYVDYAGGYGLGLFRAFLYVYLLCALRHSSQDFEDNPLEGEAFDFGGDVEDCCSDDRQPCDCSGDEPVLDPEGLENWREHCGHLQFRETDIGFFEHVWGCTPGLERWWDAVRAVWRECGRFRDRRAERLDRVGRPAIAAREGVRAWASRVFWEFAAFWSVTAIVCLFTSLGSGLMALLGIAYFVAFQALYLGIFVGMMALWSLVKLGYLLVSGLWAVVTGILCAIDYIWEAIKWLAERLWDAITWLAEQIRRGLVAACEWAQDVERRCVSWAEERRRECEEYRTEKRRECRERATREREECREYRTEKRKECKEKGERRRKECCDWVPCSWACKSFHWVVETVCVAYHWVTEKVCVAWETVKETVCVAYHWVSEKVCEAYTTIVEKSCEAFEWVVTGATCWAR